MPIVPPAVQSNTHTFSMQDVDSISRKFFRAMPKDVPVPTIEQALLWAYLNVCEGVKTYPPESAQARACLVLAMASRDLVARIGEVALLPDDQVKAKLATYAPAP